MSNLKNNKTLKHNKNFENKEIEEIEQYYKDFEKGEKNKATHFLKRCLINILGIIFALFLGLSAFSIISYCWHDIDTQEQVISSFDIHKENIYYNEPISNDLLNKISNQFSLLPSGLQKDLTDNWIFIFDDKLPTELGMSIGLIKNNNYDTTDMILGGYTFTQSRVVYINSQLEENDVYESFLHELGHVISFEYGSQHGSEKWIQIYEKGIHTLDIGEYEKSNEAEFFAGCYQYYNIQKGSLEAYLPEAIEFFDNLFSENFESKNIFEKYLVGCQNSINIMRTYWRLFKQRISM